MTTSTEATAERSRVAALPVEEKVRLLTGADSWRTYGAAALGLRPIVMSDGPAGVRGITKDDRNPSASIPCPSALGATWDGELIRELAAAMAAEARGKGVDVVLAPTINLMRTPLGGRGFECFSEDPVLSARLAVGYVRGLRAGGVGAAVKHYVGNDSETERWTYDVRIAEAVLRELYLVPFEACVREAGTAMVMAAYNAVNGARMTEHPWLLRDVLKGEWGFAGAVVSDWDAARSTVPTAQAGLDLVMPGPDGPWGEALVQAVRDGTVAEELIDDKVLRLLEVARQVGALAPAAGPGTPDGGVDGLMGGPVDGAPVPGLAAAVDGRRAADGRSRAAAPGGGGLVHAAAQRAGRAAHRPGRGGQHRAHRAERHPPGDPGRRQRRGASRLHLHPVRRAAAGAGRARHPHRQPRLPHLGGRPGTARRHRHRPGDRGAGRPAGVPRRRRHAARQRAPGQHRVRLVGGRAARRDRLGGARHDLGAGQLHPAAVGAAPGRRGRRGTAAGDRGRRGCRPG